MYIVRFGRDMGENLTLIPRPSWISSTLQFLQHRTRRCELIYSESITINVLCPWFIDKTSRRYVHDHSCNRFMGGTSTLLFIFITDIVLDLFLPFTPLTTFSTELVQSNGCTYSGSLGVLSCGTDSGMGACCRKIGLS